MPQTVKEILKKRGIHLKRIISLVLAAFLLVTFLPLSTAAVEEPGAKIFNPREEKSTVNLCREAILSGTVSGNLIEQMSLQDLGVAVDIDPIKTTAELTNDFFDSESPSEAHIDPEQEEILYDSLAYKPELTKEEKATVEAELIKINEKAEREAGLIPLEDQTVDARNVTPATYLSAVSDTTESLPEGPKTAPQLLYRLEQEIQVRVEEGLEYSIDNGEQWTTSGNFTYVNLNTEYIIVSRYEKSEETPASAVSPPLVVTTTIKPKAPSQPIATSIDQTSISVESPGAEASVRYSIDDGQTWKEDGVFNGLNPGEEYTIVAYYPEQIGEDARFASELSEPLVVTTVPEDAYLVSNESELLDVVAKIENLPTENLRSNVRLKNNITVSNTVILPPLVSLDLSGFTLRCTKLDTTAVEINTEGIGDSRNSDNTVIHNGEVVAAGNGCGICVDAGAVATLSNLTFVCEIAVENSGEIELLEHVQGRIKNDGYIGTISGTDLVAQGMDEWEIYNAGTIDKITDCSYFGGLEADTVWRGFFDETRVGFIHNLGFIGEIANTNLSTERPIVLFNGRDAEIGTISGSRWGNSNYNRGALCLNYGVIDTIQDGSYHAWNSLFLNHGVIRHILGGEYDTSHDGVGDGINNRTKEEHEYLKSVNDVYACFGNWGTIEDVAGGIYYGGYGLSGRGGWYRNGETNLGRTWVDRLAFRPQSEDAVFQYREGFGMSRNIRNTEHGRGFLVAKVYKVQYNNEETSWYKMGRAYTGEGLYDQPVINGSYEGYDGTNGYGVWPVYAPEEMPDWLYYCEGDTVWAGDLLAEAHYSVNNAVPVRNVQGKYLDCDGHLMEAGPPDRPSLYALMNRHHMYTLDRYEVSDPQFSGMKSFQMPAHDITFTPKYRYDFTRSYFPCDERFADYYERCCTSVLANVVIEQTIHPGDADWKFSGKGYSLGIIVHGLEDIKPYASSVKPVSNWEAYQNNNRPYHYEWSLDRSRWYLSEEEAPIDAQVCAANEEERGKEIVSPHGPYCLWIRRVANEGSYDQQCGIGNSLPEKMLEMSLGCGNTRDLEAPNGGWIFPSNVAPVTLQAGLGSAKKLTNGWIEVQVELEDVQGNRTPFQFTKDTVQLEDTDKSELQYNSYTYFHPYDPSIFRCSIQTYGPGIIRDRIQKVTLLGIQPGTKVRARWRQMQRGYLTSQRDVDVQNDSINGNYTWYLDAVSVWSDWAETTIKRKVAAPLQAPTLLSRTESKLVVQTEPGMEYKITGQGWQTSGIFEGLRPGQRYEIISRYAENEWDLPSPYSASLFVTTKVSIAEVLPIDSIAVKFGTSADELQALLHEKHPKVSVTLSNNSPDIAKVSWNVADSGYNGSARGFYTVYGTLELTEAGPENSGGHQAEIKVEVEADPTKIITAINPEEITVKQYAILSNEGNRTTRFGPPTILPKLPEEVTIHCKGGQARLPANWEIEDYDSTRADNQVFKGYPDCNGTEYTNPHEKYSDLTVTVETHDYMFIDADIPEISLDVLPGTNVEELNALLVEKGKSDFPLDMFALDSGDELVTFYPIELRAEYCDNYQMDVPGDYVFTVPWPDNIIPAEEEELPAIQVNVHVSEPLVITGVDLETITPFQSVPIIDPKFPTIPSQVNVTLEGDIKIPVDVEWDWSTYNPDAAAEQLVIGELVNLPSKAKQPEGEAFTGKLKAAVIPVDYEITELLSDNLFVPDAGLTLAEITELLQPTLTFQIHSVTEGVDLTMERTVAVTLEDEKNPQFDPKEIYEDFVTGTLDLPENISYAADSGFDQIALMTQPVQILKIESSSLITREGTEFADIANKPETVVATLSVVGLNGENKKETLSVDWGTGEGYNPCPAELTDDNTVFQEIEGSIVDKPNYIVTSRIKPVLFVGICREFDIEEITPSKFPEAGELEVPLGSNLEDIYNKLDQHTVQLALTSTNGVLSTSDVTFELREEDNAEYDPAVLGSSVLIAHIPLEDNIKNPKGLQVEIHVKTMRYVISTAKVTQVKGVASGTAFEDVPLPETAVAVRDDGESENLPVTWDGSKYNPTKLGGQFVNGTFNTPLPLHLENPDNRQPKAYVTIVNPKATILSMEQVFDEPEMMLMSLEDDAGEEIEVVPGYVEYKFRVELQHEDGSITEEIISLYMEER